MNCKNWKLWFPYLSQSSSLTDSRILLPAHSTNAKVRRPLLAGSGLLRLLQIVSRYQLAIFFNSLAAPNFFAAGCSEINTSATPDGGSVVSLSLTKSIANQQQDTKAYSSDCLPAKFKTPEMLPNASFGATPISALSDLRDRPLIIAEFGHPPIQCLAKLICDWHTTSLFQLTWSAFGR